VRKGKEEREGRGVIKVLQQYNTSTYHHRHHQQCSSRTRIKIMEYSQLVLCLTGWEGWPFKLSYTFWRTWDEARPTSGLVMMMVERGGRVLATPIASNKHHLHYNQTHHMSFNPFHPWKRGKRGI